MRNTPQVAVILVCWNNRDLLDECLQSIYNQTYKNIRVVLVDNGSTDDSVEYARNNHKSVHVIDTGKNNGFAIGNNIGIKYAFKDKNCKYVALLNTDARLAKDWIETLVKFAEKHPKGASFQTRTLDYYDHHTLDSRGLKIDQQGRAIQLGYRNKNPRKLDDHKVFGTNLAAALISRQFLEAQPFGEEYFDTDLWMYLEDVDFAARSIVMGWDNWVVGKSCAYHMGSASSSGNPGFSVFMTYRNNALVIYKNLPASTIIRVIPGLIFTDLESLYRTFRGRNYTAFKAIIKGRFRSLSMLFKLRNKRKLLQKYKVITNAELWEIMK